MGKDSPDVNVPDNPYMGTLANISNALYAQTNPLRSTLLNQLKNTLQGKVQSGLLPGYAPAYMLARSGPEEQYQVARDQAFSRMPAGGAIQHALGDLDIARAKDVGSLPAQIAGRSIEQMYNLANASSWAGAGQATAGLSSAGSQWQSGYSSNLNAAMQQQQQDIGVMGMLGSGIGSILSMPTGGTTTAGTAATVGTQILGSICCFIFIEANGGTLHPIVRRYRDEHMTSRNRRGYYRLAERLVPLMRRSGLVRTAVEWGMVNPMTSYGKWFYGEGKIGVIFWPITKLWLKAFDLLGFGVFIRRNGEVI